MRIVMELVIVLILLAIFYMAIKAIDKKINYKNLLSNNKKNGKRTRDKKDR